jgi:hypothetical protein
LAVFIAVLLLLPQAMDGASGIGRHVLAAASPNLTAKAALGDAGQTNFFEISYGLKASAGSPEPDYTEQLLKALRKREGWLSQVLPSEGTMVKAERECRANKTSCDVVGVTEEIQGERMILKLSVTSVLHKPNQVHKNGDFEHPCNEAHYGLELCRATLIEQVVADLLGLDKDHKGSRVSDAREVEVH